ncbi:MAG: redoxin domain-containing protein [Gemmatimonadota bacterium]
MGRRVGSGTRRRTGSTSKRRSWPSSWAANLWSETMAAPLIGKKAPAFKVQDDAGETVSLASLKGEWVVLFFYPINTSLPKLL